ncbi:methyltransferase domain-containing protein [Palleronia sp.]|uniref:methyltransferase domain-containing protein n=1 Tax=Palleronia sp. TaxID=1940284 RepID=UPI0035C82C5C
MNEDSVAKSTPRQDENLAEVGQNIRAGNGRWSFGGTVAEGFESHIEKSVPQYREGHELCARISDWFLYGGATAIELGCSTGALTRRLAEWNAGKGARFVGIEIEPAMATAARRLCDDLDEVEIRDGDALEIELEPADLILSYYTIQFVRPARRQELMDKIYSSLNWGGGFLMFEKVRAPDARFQDMMSTLYNDFKLDNGLGEAEIVHKTRSLKGVLEPFSTQGNLDMMRRAGFSDITTVFKNICFEGFLAIK